MTNYAIIKVEMVEEVEAVQEKKGLGGSSRWHWEALKQAKTSEQFRAVLAEVLEKVGDSDVTVTLHIAGSAYVRVMGNAWLAKQYGEIEEINPQSYFDRALQVMEIVLKNVAVRRRGR